ncbi:MAG TPA: FeoA family protein [Anaerolineaceae bacterium]|nr:FeoA family protein [Anaerolineaceae bacterium]
MESNQITLLNMPMGTSARVLAIKSSKRTTEKLHQLGIRVGVDIELLRAAPLEGPLLIRVSGREIAIGYELCSSILVGERN